VATPLCHKEIESEAEVKLRLIIYADGVAQGRPRAFKTKTGKIRTYDPPKSREWKYRVAWEARQQKVPMLKGALGLKAIFFRRRPKSVPKKVRYPVTKPDYKNLIAGTEDALQGICFENDSQIVQAEILKVYCPEGQRPRVEIELWEVDE
jgi:Holliday junction resolvase RusA-like endonuclease